MELGPLSDIASEPGVTDIAVTCDGTVWVDRGQGMRPYAMRAPFANPQAIRDFAVRLCSQLGRRLDDACPIADASTVEGVRVHAVIAPLVPQGAAISIRLPDAVAPSLESLAKNGMFPSKWMPLLEGFVERKASVLVTGGTGAGKTTLLKAMLMRCAPGERIITVEEVRELGMLDHDNRVSLVTRDANMEGKGAIGLSQLICATLRMRPDRIVVGECRGSEIVDLLRALNSGHRGGMTTLHTNQVAAVPSRLVALGLLAGLNPQATAALAQDAFDVVLHVERMRPSAHHTNRATRICGRQTAWKPAGRMERQPDAGLAAVARFRTCMESLNRGGWMGSLDVIAAILFGLAVWLWLRRNTYDVGERTRDGSGCAGGRWSKEHGGKQGLKPEGIDDLNASSNALPAIGCVACVASLRASVRSGATLVQAFEELGGTPFATPELTRLRITMVIRSRCPLKEQFGQGGQSGQVERLSGELYAACRLSLTLGCEIDRCLQAVAESLKRQRLLDDLRANAFAMPKATMKLLMALPLLTVLLGEGMGVHSLVFLVSGVKGLACLGFALCCYTFGLIWIRALMRQDDMKGAI